MSHPAPADPVPRRGARRPSEVPPEVLRALEAGQASVNHMEQMAMDAGALLAAVEPAAASRADELRVPRFLDRLRAGARIMWDVHGEDLFDAAAEWESDTARGWAAFAVPLASGGAERRLGLALRFADDPHFAVREWAWLGARPIVAADPALAVRVLAGSVRDPSLRIRRFCSEATRPRGVWSSHIPLLKARPGLGLPVLDPLAGEHERYVQDSVANWLNDAARTAPEWVLSTLKRWSAEHPDRSAYVARRATRGLTASGRAWTQAVDRAPGARRGRHWQGAAGRRYGPSSSEASGGTSSPVSVAE